MASLESQISSLRDELATVYKTQGQNAQRLLSMNETLREKEELSRIDTDNLRKTKEEVASLRKKVEQHNELMAEKDRTAQVRLEIFFSDRVRANRQNCPRFCMTRLILSNWNWARSRSAVRHYKKTTRNSSNAGWTQSKQKPTK